MIRRDWFKRQIAILAQALGAVIGLKGKGDPQASVAAVEEALRTAFGMGAPLALGLPTEEFLALACRGEKPTAELLSALSSLFEEWARALKAAGRSAEAESASARASELGALGAAQR